MKCPVYTSTGIRHLEVDTDLDVSEARLCLPGEQRKKFFDTQGSQRKNGFILLQERALTFITILDGGHCHVEQTKACYLDKKFKVMESF